MDRRALVLYLENVRDLEVARAIVGGMFNRDKYLYEKAIKERNSKKHPIYDIPDFKYEPRGGCFVFCAFMAIACVMSCVFFATGMMLGKLGNMSWMILFYFLGAGLFYGLMNAADPGSKRKQEEAYQRKIDSLKIENEQATAQNAEISRSMESLYNEWRKKEDWYKNEYSMSRGFLKLPPTVKKLQINFSISRMIPIRVCCLLRHALFCFGNVCSLDPEYRSHPPDTLILL